MRVNSLLIAERILGLCHKDMIFRLENVFCAEKDEIFDCCVLNYLSSSINFLLLIVVRFTE